MGFSLLSAYSLLLCCHFLFLLAPSCGNLTEEHSFSFSFSRFEKNASFDSEIDLYSDAEIVDSTVRITHPRASSRGRVMYRNPISFGRKPSFSTYFSFSISPGNGDGLAFLLAPSNVPPESLDGHLYGVSPGVLAVEFDTFMDSASHDPNGNHVGVDMGSVMSVKTGNASALNLVLNSGDKLHTWIDFDGDLKMLEVRLSKSGISRSSDPLISYPVDLSGMIWRDAIFVGISSSSGNSTQSSTLYAWSFRLKHGAPYLMHSEPLDPRLFPEPSKQPLVHRRRVYLSKVLVALMFGAACGAIVTLLVLFAWSAIMNHRPIRTVEYPVHPVEYDFEKIMVAGDKVDHVGKQ